VSFRQRRIRPLHLSFLGQRPCAAIRPPGAFILMRGGKRAFHPTTPARSGSAPPCRS
jgi:hypothetical protein